jgi:hypothetical protein
MYYKYETYVKLLDICLYACALLPKFMTKYLHFLFTYRNSLLNLVYTQIMFWWQWQMLDTTSRLILLYHHPTKCIGGWLTIKDFFVHLLILTRRFFKYLPKEIFMMLLDSIITISSAHIYLFAKYADKLMT